MTPDEAAGVISILADNYPNAKFSPTAHESWAFLMHDIPVQAVLQELPLIMEQTPVYPPSGPAVRRGVIMARLGIPGYEDGWGEVMKALHRYSAQESPEFADPVTAKVVRLIGWTAIAMTDLKDLDTLRAQFRDIYRAQSEKAYAAITRQGFAAISAGVTPALEG